VLTGGQPYFLLWWATVGLTLTNHAMEWGVLALGLFALVHWMCDLGWLEVLSFAGFKGSEHWQTCPEDISLICVPSCWALVEVRLRCSNRHSYGR